VSAHDTTARSAPSRATGNHHDAGSPASAEHALVPGGVAGLIPLDPWMRASQVATIGLFTMALLWAAHVSRPFLVPVLLAWVIATIFHPIVRFLQAHRVPRVLSAVLITLGLIALMVGVLLLLASPVTYWVGRAAELGALLREKFQMLNQPLALIDEMRRALSSITGSEPGALKVEQPSASVVSTTYTLLTPAVSELVLFVGALLFYLIYQERIRNTLVMLLRGRDARLQALRTLKCIDDNMATYFSTYTLVNLCLGIATSALAYAVGLPNPLLWGVLACVLNYIAYLGPAVVTVTLAFVGLLTFPSLAEAAVAPLVYLGIVVLEGQFLTPYLMGRRLELNPFAVFLAIAFCVWLWGPVGAFLAVPLLMATTVAVEHAFAEAKPLPG
jgi:predicted PurR-regulated permease PerM